ncbi:uncharacterized protein LOC124147553 isoform X2 [Haliotis rufescens]|uniref:uncharacterized protein LOC124147553 isoform X2 n=1 Tax=Haliotis rufescens TaxID=6454 RepID=UPI00201EAF91|nr:uncharacterized protein LOC124147553 isoform X2 [Haliotis rufescens]
MSNPLLNDLINAYTTAYCKDEAGLPLSCPRGCCGSLRYRQFCCDSSSKSVGLPTGVIVAIVFAVILPLILVFGIACCCVYCRGASSKQHRHVIHTSHLAVINTGYSTETDDFGNPIRPPLRARQFRPPSTNSTARSPHVDYSTTSTSAVQPLKVPPPHYNEGITTNTTVHEAGPMITTV